MVDHVLTDMNEYVSYDYSSSHKALDIVGSGGTTSDVMAFADGTVEIVVSNVKYTNHNTKGTATYGNYIKIKHNDGHKTLYAHLKYGSILVNTGDTVKKGQKIATMGATGNAYGTHLHFEVRKANNVRENPMEYLTGKKTIDTPSLEEAKEDPKEEIIETPKEDVEENTEETVKEDVKEEIKEETSTNEQTINPPVSKDTEELIEPKENVSETNTYSQKANSPSYKTTHVQNNTYKGGSIVDGLKGISYDSSFKYRTKLAQVNGIDNYRGTYNQNVYLLTLLKQGKLIKA